MDYTVLFPGDRREAPAIARKGDRYYMLSSACTGWDPNPANLSYTDTLTKDWSPLHKVGNPIAFDTQAASILKVEGSKDTTYLYIGDRWQDPNLPESKTIIFPISFSDDDCTFNYVPEFDINFATGEWRPVDPREGMADRTGWKVIESSGAKAGNPVGNVLDGDLTTIWIDEAEATAKEGEEVPSGDKRRRQEMGNGVGGRLATLLGRCGHRSRSGQIFPVHVTRQPLHLACRIQPDSTIAKPPDKSQSLRMQLHRRLRIFV